MLMGWLPSQQKGYRPFVFFIWLNSVLIFEWEIIVWQNIDDKICRNIQLYVNITWNSCESYLINNPSIGFERPIIRPHNFSVIILFAFIVRLQRSPSCTVVSWVITGLFGFVPVQHRMMPEVPLIIGSWFGIVCLNGYDISFLYITSNCIGAMDLYLTSFRTTVIELSRNSRFFGKRISLSFQEIGTMFLSPSWKTSYFKIDRARLSAAELRQFFRTLHTTPSHTKF